MGILFLDTRFRGEAALWWEDAEGEEVWVEAQDTQDVLRAIQSQRERLSASLRGIGIVPGPGRFSAVRVGILYAHVLARWYKVPLYRLTAEEVASPEARRSAYSAIQAGNRAHERWIDPEYDRAPNITHKSL